MQKGLAMNENKDWQTEDDLRALKRIVEIKNDPERMKRLKAKIAAEKEVYSDDYLKQIGLK